jgi:DNA-binding transcriptional LysR family regulator
MDHDVELRQLRIFVVLARELHFGRAAAVLRVAQPALSQQIRKLETRVGFALFHRTSRKVALTDAGAVLLESARRALSEIERAVEAGRQVTTGEVGTLSIGYVATAMVTVLPDAIRRFRQRHPRVRLLLKEIRSAMQPEAFASGAIDLGFSSDVPTDAPIDAQEVWRDSLVALLPSAHPAAKRSRLKVSALASAPFVLFPRAQAPNLYDMIVGLCRANRFDPVIAQEAQSWHAIASLVAAGLGVSIAPESVKRYRITRLRHVPLPRSAGSVGIMMCTPRGGPSSAARLFIDAVEA